MGGKQKIDRQEQLVEAIKTNDQKVLKTLYQDNYKKVEIYILQNSGSMPHAKDIFQEAFLAMYENIKAGKFLPSNETALQGYLYRIAKNKWIDRLRSPKFKNTASFEENIFNANENVETENEYIADEKMQVTIRAFEKLDAKCKELLTQFYYQKKSMRDIATETNLGEASARNKKYRCIQKLRDIALSPN